VDSKSGQNNKKRSGMFCVCNYESYNIVVLHTQPVSVGDIRSDDRTAAAAAGASARPEKRRPHN
jgi:hypothetical protein